MMGGSDEQGSAGTPTEQRGGTPPSEAEASAKGPWAAKAAEGIVPTELGGADAPPRAEEGASELGDAVTGVSTGSEEPATDTGIDHHGGEHADAIVDGAPEGAVTAGDDAEPDRSHEPDLRDAAVGPRQSDLKSAE